MSSSESDILLSGLQAEESLKLERAVRRNARSQKRRNCVFLSISCVIVGVTCASMIFLKQGTKQTSSILDHARQAKSMVRIDPQSGEYSVDFDLSTEPIVPAETTFVDLAKIMLLPWYEASLMAVESDPAWTGRHGDGDNGHGITPSNVKEVRRALLMTRNMLDVFGPVFPSKMHQGKDKSLWRELRKQYRNGYQKLGYLKDLDGLTYSQELVKARVDEVLAWKIEFVAFQKKHRIRHFLYTPSVSKGGGLDPEGCYNHKSSHLFWSETATVPCGTDIGTTVLRKLGSVQLSQSLVFLNEIREYTTVIPQLHEVHFHNLRKELRVFLDGYNLFGKVLVPTKSNSTSTSTRTIDTSSSTATESVVDQQTDKNNQADDQLLIEELQTLNTAQIKLGKINDKWTAHQIYVTNNSHKEKQQPLAKEVDKLWMKFLTWQDEQKLEDCINDVKKRMNTTTAY